MSSVNFQQFVIFNGILVLSSLTHTGHGQDFGYDGNNGPSHWGEKYQHCVGKHQSPIDIQEHQVQLVDLPPMVFKNFDWKPAAAVLKNNGHTVAVTLETNKKPAISGGPLIGDYEFAQLHFHWGANDEEGSENTINNSSFPLELHMVFFQTAYETFEESIEHPDGLTVLSFLYSNAEKENLNYKSLLEALPLVQNPQSMTNITEPPFLKELISRDLSVYFTYGGSLTTPPCSEVVTWIEFKNTVPMAHHQIEVFRQLNSESGKLLHNFRPVQPLHGRRIRMTRGEISQQRISLEKPINEESLNQMDNLACTIKSTYNIVITFILSFLVYQFVCG